MGYFKQLITEKPKESSKEDNHPQSNENVASSITPPIENEEQRAKQNIGNASSTSYYGPNDTPLRDDLTRGLRRDTFVDINAQVLQNPQPTDHDQIIAPVVEVNNIRSWRAWAWRAFIPIAILVLSLIFAWVQGVEESSEYTSPEDFELAVINEELGHLAKISGSGAFLSYEISKAAFPLDDAADEVEARQLRNRYTLAPTLRSAAELVSEISDELAEMATSGSAVIDMTISTQIQALNELQATQRWRMIPTSFYAPRDEKVRKWLLVTLDDLVRKLEDVGNQGANLNKRLIELKEKLGSAKSDGVSAIGRYVEDVEEIRHNFWYIVFGVNSNTEQKYSRHIATLNNIDGGLEDAREVVLFTMKIHSQITKQIKAFRQTINEGKLGIREGDSIKGWLDRWGRSTRRLMQIDAAAQHKRKEDMRRSQGGIHRPQIQPL